MKKLLISAVLAGTFLTGCASLGNSSTPATPQDFVNKFCPSVKIIASDLAILPDMPESVVDDLKKASVFIDPVCSAGASDMLSLQSVVNNAIPLLKNAIIASNIPSASAIILSISAAQIIWTQVVAITPMPQTMMLVPANKK